MDIYNTKNKSKILYKIIFVLLCFVFTNNVQAADLRFDVGNDEKLINKYFNVDFFIDTQKQDINAFEAEISFSEDIIKFKEARIGGSIINLWLEEPQIKNNKIKFSGITPGGYYGEDGFLVRFIFETDKVGEAYINIDNFVSLANDGQGTRLDTSFSNINFVVTEDAAQEVVKVGIADHQRPEAFQPIISKIPDIAGDDYVLLFFAQDKNSGIDYYEVKEGFGFYKKVTSPYIIKRQELDVDIYVRAVDKAGNIRLEIIEAPYASPWYKKIDRHVIIYIIVAILIVAILAKGLKIKWTKSKQK